MKLRIKNTPFWVTVVNQTETHYLCLLSDDQNHPHLIKKNKLTSNSLKESLTLFFLNFFSCKIKEVTEFIIFIILISTIWVIIF